MKTKITPAEPARPVTADDLIGRVDYTPPADVTTPEQTARLFHDTYERLAPRFGYETRQDTKQFDPTSKNGKLMIAVCGEVAGKLVSERDAAQAQLALYKRDFNASRTEELEVSLSAAQKREDAAEKRVKELEDGIKDPHKLHIHCLRYLSPEQIAHLFSEKHTENLNALRAENGALRKEVLDTVEDSCRQGCFTALVKKDYNGQVDGTKVTDSGALSSYASDLRRLAEAGRFRIVAEHGRMVVGYWPENDPQAALAQREGGKT